MPRRPAQVTQAEIARMIRAAKQAGAREVVGPGGYRIILDGGAVNNGEVGECPAAALDAPAEQADREEEIIL